MTTLARSAAAAPPRTLAALFRRTTDQYPQAPAIDDGHQVLTYVQLLREAEAISSRLRQAGAGPGLRVGIRMPSGSADLYVGILGVLLSGAAYVPVDADDPVERAELVLGSAHVVAIISEDLTIEPARASRHPVAATAEAGPDDDAWVIFTSGSTGTPKGVAVSHRSAAAFVDAEAELFCQDRPLGPGDRVLAGLSVAFDASCEEMWLAWRHGACLVPAPRALVRSGMDLAPWLVDRGITVVSTVPTLASLWPAASLDDVRLLIFGGEACPPELVDRLAVGEREVWNTYGPTEATVVSCAARMRAGEPVRIGQPLNGWDLAVVDGDLSAVALGTVGELIIGGVGLARYLDPELTAQRFAPVPTLGWERGYRSGDLVRADDQGLFFVGRADDQVKVGGRRIELGEVDSALLRLPGVRGAAAAVRATEAGNKLLVGYLTMADGAELDRGAAAAVLRQSLPAALVPLLAVVDDIPVRTSGKVDRDALPWPLPVADDDVAEAAELTGTAAWVSGHWASVLGVSASGPGADFFADGGGSLAAAQLVSALRARFPAVTVADVYESPRLGALADRLDEFDPPHSTTARSVAPLPRRSQLVQTFVSIALVVLPAARWCTWVAAVANVADWFGGPTWLPTTSWWAVAAAWLVVVSPWGRMAISVAVARLLLRGVRSGHYPRGGSVHLRLWAAEATAEACGAAGLSGAPWITTYARALGAKIGRGVDLHTVPPVTGLLTLGKRASLEPEVDVRGHWMEGDTLHVGRVRVGADASVGSRSILLPGARVGQGAEVVAGSAVSGQVPPGELWAGSPAARVGVAHGGWPARRPRPARQWVLVYGVTAAVLSAYPALAAVAGLSVAWPALRQTADVVAAARVAVIWSIPSTVVSLLVYALLTVLTARLLAVGLSEGYHPVRSRLGWQVWATERLMDEARTYLYPMYASLITPLWLRALGGDVGHGVEASTVLMLPAMTTIGDDAFLADDTLVASYELAGGYLRVERAKIGKRSFLGNSGMTGPGRVLPKNSLVAVLSAAPERAKAGTSWLGSPPVQLRRDAGGGDESRTFRPSGTVKTYRGLVEACRIVPAAASLLLGLVVALVLADRLDRDGFVGALVAAVPLLLAAGAVAAAVATIAKWVLVGRHERTEHPLWSSFVWRNELADMFVELLAVPWFVNGTLSTPVFILWLRSLGAKVGRGVWCETYWLPEPDLVSLGPGASVNRGCVLQTHLFHDRIMSMDTVTLQDGATLGPQSVILPAASLGESAVVGPSSLVLRGDDVPAGSRWTGNPIAPWA